MTRKIKTRWGAFGVHLLLSVLVLSVVLLVTCFIWFPGELFHAGAVVGLKIIVIVDLVLGPLLTLIVFDRAKKSLKFDLLIIAFIQLCFLGYGLKLLESERPAAQVLADDGIHLITKSEVDQFELLLPPSKSTIHPTPYFLNLPDDWSHLPSLKLTTELVSEKPFAYREDLYELWEKIDKQKYELRITNIVENLKIGARTESSDDRECQWLPLHSKHASGSVCFNFEFGIVSLNKQPEFIDINE